MKVAIAGCGIAGLSAGVFLARAGHDVLILDKADVPSPVGSGLVLQPVGLAVLETLGCRAALEACGARIDRLFGRVIPSGRPSGKIVLDVRYGPRRFGVAVHRASLFQTLYEAAMASGAQIVHGCEVLRIEARRDGQWLHCFREQAQTKLGAYDLVIDALGARSCLGSDPGSDPGSDGRTGRDLPYGALWANLDWPVNGPFDDNTLEQRYEYASRMVGVLPIGSLPDENRRQLAFFWSLRQDAYPSWKERPLDDWKADVARIWPQAEALLAPITHHDQLIMARYRHRTLASPVSGRCVHLGDSFHAASPQLGQGANMALLDAMALAAALELQPDLDTALHDYARRRYLHVSLYQLISLVFTPFYQSDGRVLAALRDHLMSPLSQMWPVQRLLAGMVAGELGMPLYQIGKQASFMPLARQSGQYEGTENTPA